jgi:hypothetical protein
MLVQFGAYSRRGDDVHVKRAYAKLGICRRTLLVRRVSERGIRLKRLWVFGISSTPARPYRPVHDNPTKGEDMNTRLGMLVSACVAALVLAGTSGATHLGPLELGHANSSTAQTTLTANLGTPVLKVVNQGAAAALRGDAQTGIGVNGVSVSGTGQQARARPGSACSALTATQPAPTRASRGRPPRPTPEAPGWWARTPAAAPA